MRGHVVPRISTPPLGALTPDTTLGFAFEAFCEVIGRPLLAWQAEVGRRLLELRDGRLRYRTGLLVVGRQCGKSELACLLALYFLYRRRVRLVVGTAQTVDIAREVWLRAGDIIEEADDVLEPAKVYHANGKERLEFADGRRYLVKSASRRSRGLSPALILADELREQTDWEAWQAITAMTLAQPEGLVFALSSAGEHDSSVVLNALQAKGRAQDQEVGDEATDFYYAEYSAPDGADIDDPRSWAYGMPALGDTVTLAAVEGLRGTLPPAQFRTEVLCQTIAAREESVIDLDAWQSCADAAGTLDSARGRLAAAVDVSPDGHTSLAVAGMAGDGVVRVELAASWSSPSEARVELTELIGRIAPRKLGWFASSPTAALAQDIRAAAGDRAVKLTDPSEACQAFASLVAGLRLRHGSQSLLDEHVAGATRMRKGSGWVFARRDVGAPVSGAYAAAGAVLLARQMPAPSAGRLIVAA